MNAPERAGGPQRPGGDERLQQVNEALLVSSLHQQELTEDAERSVALLLEKQQALQRQLDDTELLRALGAELVAQDNVELIYQKVVDTAAALMRSEFASLQAFHPEIGDGGELQLLAQRGFSTEASEGWQIVTARDKTSCGVALEIRKRCIVPDIESCAFLAQTETLIAYRRAGIRSVQSTPLISRFGKLIGMLSTHWREPHDPSERDLHLFDLLARQSADLLDQWQAEIELRDSEMETRRLLDLMRSTMTSMAEGLYTVDVQGRTTSVNPEAERLLGWTTEELLGRRMHEVVHYKHPDGSPFPADECPEQRGLERGEAVMDLEGAFIRKDGSFFEVSYSAAPLRAGGTVLGSVVVFQDITERKRSRQELTRASEELASMNRNKDEFLAMLSHELRNPLAPIQAAVYLLGTQKAGPETLIGQQARRIIERQVANLTKLVNDLLEVSRVVSGRVHLDSRVLDLNKIVEHAVETSRSGVEAAKHAMSVSFHRSAVWVMGDAVRLEEVFVNLLNNAVKFTPAGGHIELFCEQPSGSDHAQVRVRDDGVGIEESLILEGRLFELFTQADRSLARSAGGLGIGLSLSHRLVNLHGGSIDVRSPPEGADKGSEFTVRLPLVSPPARVEPEGPVNAPPHGGLRVLVVDDNPDFVLMLCASLRHEGYSVREAYSGSAALELALDWRPDVVLLDIGLPDLSGYEVAKSLRADESSKASAAPMRLIAMTGYGLDTDIALAREAGFDAHLTKPVAFKDLMKLLAAVPSKS